MAAPSVSYQLLPWTREGIASTLNGPDSSTAPAVAEVSVELSVDGELIHMPFRLYGPGDVRALDTTQIIRTDPVQNTLDFESNCFPAVEFRRPTGLDGFLAVEKHLLVQRGIFAHAHRREPNAWDLDAETAAEVERLHLRLQHALELSSL